MKDEQTIAQQINWDFKTNGDLEIQDKNGNQIYSENSSGFWVKWEYDSEGNEIYYKKLMGEFRWSNHKQPTQAK